MELVGNLHVMGFFHLARSDRFMTAQAILIDAYIRIKETGKELTAFRMTIHTGYPFGMNL